MIGIRYIGKRNWPSEAMVCPSFSRLPSLCNKPTSHILSTEIEGSWRLQGSECENRLVGTARHAPRGTVLSHVELITRRSAITPVRHCQGTRNYSLDLYTHTHTHLFYFTKFLLVDFSREVVLILLTFVLSLLLFTCGPDQLSSFSQSQYPTPSALDVKEWIDRLAVAARALSLQPIPT